MTEFKCTARSAEFSGKKIQVLDIIGSIDSSSITAIDQAFNAALQTGAKHFILNMAQMDYISSAGLRALLKYRKLAFDAGGIMKIAAVHREIRENVFDALGFSRLIEVYGTTQEAIESMA